MSSPPAKLFQPINVGTMSLSHRVVLAPLTRMRVHPDLSPLPSVKEYYVQRAGIPGTFLISESVTVAPQASGFPYFPEVFTDKQIAGWKEVVDAVHKKESYIYLQIMAMGRAAKLDALKAINSSYDVLAPSAIPAPDGAIPREMTEAEIKEFIGYYARCASDAVNKAGFDGVEVHCAHGCLAEQFTQDHSNKRTDDYGGSVENRSRFTLDVVDAVAGAIGAERTSLRVSPWSTAFGMGMKDPVPQYTHLVAESKRRQPDLAYLSVVEPRMASSEDRTPSEYELKSKDIFRGIWAPKIYLTAGGYDRDTAIETAESGNELVAFGRHFIANPDLPLRLMKNLPLNKYNRSTFYIPGDDTGNGYTDYPFYTEI